MKNKEVIRNLEDMLRECEMTNGQDRILKAFINFVKMQKDLPIKYKKLINKHFWELI